MPDLVLGGFAQTPEVRAANSYFVETLEALQSASSDCDLLVPLQLWLMPDGAGACTGKRVLVLIEASDDVVVLKDRLDTVAGIAVRFKDFNDGRGYSSAVLLRQRLGYRGPLRAVGDVLRDQLFYLLRSGFDQFEPRADRSTEEFLKGYHDFSVCYQQSATSTPLFRHRVAGLDIAETSS